MPTDTSLRVALDVTPALGNETGIGVFTRTLLDALIRESDITVSAFALTVRGISELREMLPAAIHHNRLPMPASVLTRLWQRFNYPNLESWLDAVDVAHGTNFVVPPTHNAARLVTVHDLTAVRYPELCSAASLRYPNLVAQAAKTGAHIHTLSTSVADDVQEHFGIARERIHVVSPGIPDLPESDTNVNSGNIGPYIFAIGTIEPRKDYPTLLRAFDSVARAVPDVSLVIAGAPGWKTKEFVTTLQSLKCASRVHVVGRINDAQYAGWLRGAAVLAYPSLLEGFGYPPLQAMQVDVPVVATNVGSLPEVCADAAVLVEPRNADALANALIEVLHDTTLRNDLVMRGRKRVASFDWGEAVPKFIELYRRILSYRAG